MTPVRVQPFWKFIQQEGSLLLRLIGKNQDTAKCFQNYLPGSGELRHKEQADNNTRPLKCGGGNHSNHRDSKESPRIPSLLVNRMQEPPPGYIHLSIRLSLLVPFMCSSSCVSHHLMRKCEESESARNRATSPSFPGLGEGQDHGRAQKVMSLQRDPGGEMHGGALRE